MDDIREALTEFVDAVDACGGVARTRDGLHEPLGDREWVDLGEAYMNACAALGRPAQVIVDDEEDDDDDDDEDDDDDTFPN